MSDVNIDGPDHRSETSTGPIFSAAWYDRLKWFTLIFLPSFGAAYFGLSAVWENLPYATEVVGTSAVLGTFMGLILGISNSNFKKAGADGHIDAFLEGDTVVLSRLALPNISADELALKKTLTIQVNPNQPSQ